MKTKTQNLKNVWTGTVWMLLLVCTMMLGSCTDPYGKYTSWYAREAVLMQMQGTHEDYNDLMFRWLSDPAAVDYPFDRLQAQSPIRKAVSPDGKLCVFSWDSFEGGILNKWNNVIHYKDGDGVYTMQTNLWSLLAERGGNSALALKDGDDLGCVTMDIRQTTDKDGRTIYLTVNHLFDSYWSDTDVNVFTIADGKIVPLTGMFVLKDGTTRDEVDFSYMVDFWTRRTEEYLSMTPVFAFAENGDVLTPLPGDDVDVSERYERFAFNGEQFIQTDTVHNIHLHPSLRDFREIGSYHRIGEKFLHVDKMQDDRYRCAVWTVGNAAPEEIDMTRMPDLVLTDGIVDDELRCYVFTMDGLEYRVKGDWLEPQTFEILRDGQTVFKQEYQADVDDSCLLMKFISANIKYLLPGVSII